MQIAACQAKEPAQVGQDRAPAVNQHKNNAEETVRRPKIRAPGIRKLGISLEEAYAG